MMPLLEVKDIVMQFGGLKALNHVSLTVEEGKISGLIGPNGSGKTTLFNVITGFLVPTEGTVSCNGESIGGMPAYDLVSMGIARTFQNIHLLQEMTVEENVQLGLHHELKHNFLDAVLMSKRYREEEKRGKMQADEALEFVGLGALKNEKAKNLPYGLQRKLEIARTLVTGAKLLLFDEPCAGMNTMEKEQLSSLVTKINTELKKTVLLVEHDMRVVMKLSEHIAVLSQGELLAVGSPVEIQSNPKVIEVYLGSKRKGVETNATA